MKKAIKGLIVASAVAAVVGVGAVSYAAWNGGAYKTVTTGNSSTGYVSLVGFKDNTQLAAVTDLVPWDQDNGKKVADYTLPKVTSGNDKYKITVTVDKKNGWTGALYVIVDTNGTVTPSDPGTAGNGWKAIDTGAAEEATTSVFEFDTPTGDNEVQLYAHVILDSNKSEDMSKNYSLTFTLDKQQA